MEGHFGLVLADDRGIPLHAGIGMSLALEGLALQEREALHGLSQKVWRLHCFLAGAQELATGVSAPICSWAKLLDLVHVSDHTCRL